MMRTAPCRRTILQCSHRTLTDGLTFIPGPLLESIRDAAPGQVVRRQLDLDLVPGQDPDEVHPHLAGDVGQHLVAIVQLDAEHRVRQRLHHGPFHLDRVFFGHAIAPRLQSVRVRMAGPSWVMAMVSSKWAARLPSTVTAVQRSSSTRTSHEPMVTMGSIARTMPALRGMPRPGSPKLGPCGSSWSMRPMPWPTKA